MADVFRGTSSYLAKSKDIDLGPVLDEIAAEIESYAIGLAAEHVETGDYAQTLAIAVDRTSPSGRDRLVYSDDQAAAAIEWGWQPVKKDGTPGRPVPGQHILGRAAEAVPER